MCVAAAQANLVPPVSNASRFLQPANIASGGIKRNKSRRTHYNGNPSSLLLYSRHSSAQGHPRNQAAQARVAE